MTTTKPSLARAHGGRVQHRLAADLAATLCGRSTTGMALYSPNDLPSGERTAFPACRSCQEAAPPEPRCTCGACHFTSCLCGLTPRQWVAAHPDRPLQ